MIEALLLFSGHILPGLDRVRHRRARPLLVDETHLQLAGVAAGTDFFPAELIFAEELLDVGLRRLEREVRGVVAEVKVEGLLRGERFVDEL